MLFNYILRVLKKKPANIHKKETAMEQNNLNSSEVINILNEILYNLPLYKDLEIKYINLKKEYDENIIYVQGSYYYGPYIFSL